MLLRQIQEEQLERHEAPSSHYKSLVAETFVLKESRHDLLVSASLPNSFI